VLIDLKLNDVQHHDIGQMNLYLGYFAAEENGEGDNPPIGIILTRNKDELLVEYATYQMNSQLFVQKYQLYLPDREELRRQLELTLKEAGETGE
jgi:YhcG PDDEXK nuclease domain